MDNGLFVSIVMPALNEERYISRAITSILPQTSDFDWEVIVVDGGSKDHTCAIVERMAASDPRIRLLRNERKVQSAGVNLGARNADPASLFLVRADCHAEYPEGFVEQCVRTLVTTGAASVVVPMRTQGTTCMQKAIAAAQNSTLGNGRATHRLASQSGPVEHGHHAAFVLRAFLDLGGYDECFTHNEDAELDKRIANAGGQIYLDAAATVIYYPRSNLVALARQYFNFGCGRANMLVKHRSRPRLRQFLPVLAFLTCLSSLALAPIDAIYLGGVASYVLGCVAWGVMLALSGREPCLLLSAVAAITMHMSWAAGFLFGPRYAPRD